MILYERLQELAEIHPDSPAIETRTGQITYLQLKELSDSCTQYFHSLGLVAGDRVAILAHSNPDWFVAVFAASRCGVVLVPLDWHLSADELIYVIEGSESKILLHDQEFAGTADTIKQSFTDLKLVRFGESGFPPEVSEPGFTTNVSDEKAPFLIVYTSGTTGRPKGAVLSQKAIRCSAEMSQNMTDLTVNDRVLSVLPLFHVGGLNIQPLPALLYGATLVLHEQFNPDEAVEALAEEKITLLNSVPTMLQAMMESPQWMPANYRWLRAISIGSTDVPVSLIEQVHLCGIPLIQVYGSSETGPVAIYQRIEHAPQVGSIGKAGLWCEVRLCNEDGVEVAEGESGEIQIKGDNILNNYWQDDKATADSIKDGWFCTGDIAHKDGEGYYWFDGRLTHLVISGGKHIFPVEIERLILDVAGVEEVAVVGRTDKSLGEVPVAVIAGTADSAAVLASCESLAKFKRPEDVVTVDALPRNALGKIQVHEVKTLIA